jgi:hypothetical protein
MAIPGTSPQVAPFGNAPHPGTTRYGAACCDVAVTEHINATATAARRLLMGCIIDWTGVLKAPQIAGRVIAKTSLFPAEKVDHGAGLRGDTTARLLK